MDDKAGVRPRIPGRFSARPGSGDAAGDAFQVAFPYELGRAPGVVHRVRRGHGQRAGRDPHEPVGVDRIELIRGYH